MTTNANLTAPGTGRVPSPGKRARSRASRIIVWSNVAIAPAVIGPTFFDGSTGDTALTAQIGTLLLLLTLLPSNLLRFDWWGAKVGSAGWRGCASRSASSSPRSWRSVSPTGGGWRPGFRRAGTAHAGLDAASEEGAR